MNFKEQMKTDLNVFYNNEEFATAALYKDNFISVIFTDEYEVQSLNHKMMTVRSKDVPDIGENETLQIEGITYIIDNFEFKDETKLEMVVGVFTDE